MFIEPDSSCAICAKRRELEVHHIEPRRMGGSRRPEIEADQNKIILCHDCHRLITEQRWRLTRSPERLQVVDVSTGELIARRLFDPGFQPSAYFARVNGLERGLGDLLRDVPYLADDQLVELFSELRGIDKRNWIVQAAVLWEAKQRSSYGDRAWEAMGRTFGIGWRQAYNLARVWEAFFAGKDEEFCIQVQNSPLAEVSWYIACAATERPEFWLAYAEDRKAENPHYTVADLRDEIHASQTPLLAAPELGAPDARCRWLRGWCVKLGQIVSPGQCTACDLAQDAVAALARGGDD